MDRKRAYIALLFVSATAVYLNILSNGFVLLYDDSNLVLENPWIRDLGSIPEMFSSSAWSFRPEGGPGNYYRPTLHLFFLLNYHVFGLEPWGFHLSSLLVHGLVTVVVFLVLCLLLEGRKGRLADDPQGLFPAFAGALVFAIHPVHTEAVAWVSAVSDLHVTLFFILSFYFYARSKGCSVSSLVFFALALFSKETAVVLPAVLLAHDLTCGRGVKSARPYIPYVLITVLYLALRQHALGGFAPDERTFGLNTYQVFLNIPPLFASYLVKLVFPADLKAIYVFHPVRSIFGWKVFVSIGASASYMATLLYFIRKEPRLSLALVLLALPLLPVLYIPFLGENVFTERYLYLPSFGFVFLVSIAVEKARGWSGASYKAASVIVVVIAVVFLAAAVSRNSVWRNDLSLWKDTVEKSPDSVIARGNLGMVYGAEGRFEEAAEELRAGLELDPTRQELWNNLGLVYLKIGISSEAIKMFKSALNLNESYVDARFNLALAYRTAGRRNDAIREFEHVLALNPKDRDARMAVESLENH